MGLNTLTYEDLENLDYEDLSNLEYTGDTPDPPEPPTPMGTTIVPQTFYLEKSADTRVYIYTGSSTTPTATNIVGQVNRIKSKSGGWYEVDFTPAGVNAVFNINLEDSVIPVQVIIAQEVPDAMLYKALAPDRCVNEFSLASLIMAAFKSNIDEENYQMVISKPDSSSWITRYIEVDEDLKPIKKIY